MTAWIGIWAVLMMFIGPAISQWQAMAHTVGQSTHPTNGHASPHHRNTQPDDQPLHEHEHCGYCTLVNHSPLASGSAGSANQIAHLSIQRMTPTTARGYGEVAVFPAAPVRAPPAHLTPHHTHA